jgi:hypothetical protein
MVDVRSSVAIGGTESAPLLLESEQKMVLLLQYNWTRRGLVFQECL